MDQRNLILAIVLSVVVLLGSQLLLQVFFPPPEVQPPAQTADGLTLPQPEGATLPSLPGTAQGAAPAIASRDEVLTQGQRVTIEAPLLKGSIALKGGKLDDLVLTDYRETLDPESPQIVLLSPRGVENPYYADYGWTATDKAIELPDGETLWQASGPVLSPDKPVTLTWTNPQGLTFERDMALDENYMFTVTQRVTNNSGATVTLSPYGLISRTGTPEILGFYILHEGLIGVLNETLLEVDYSDLQDSRVEKQSTTGGWIGITDKYWLMALIPDQSQEVATRFVYDGSGGTDKYQTDVLYDPIVAAPGATIEATDHLFAGAKTVLLLDEYEENLKIERFDLAVDFGWFYFLTKPLFYALDWLFKLTGNFGVAILLVTVGVKICFFPLANKSYASMAKMRKLQPQMLELRERFSDDKQRLNQEMMGLYKKEGANPLSGCLPILVQIPVFFALYKVMFVTIEMRQAPFFGWIQDLSAPDPTSFINGFGLLPWGVPALGLLDLINIGVWPLLMGITMFAQQRLNPQPPDPVQAKIFMLMPIFFTFLLAKFPAGLVIYWTWNNLLSIIQQAVIMTRAGVPLGNKAAATPAPAPKPQQAAPEEPASKPRPKKKRRKGGKDKGEPTSADQDPGSSPG